MISVLSSRPVCCSASMILATASSTPRRVRQILTQLEAMVDRLTLTLCWTQAGLSLTSGSLIDGGGPTCPSTYPVLTAPMQRGSVACLGAGVGGVCGAVGAKYR